MGKREDAPMPAGHPQAPVIYPFLSAKGSAPPQGRSLYLYIYENFLLQSTIPPPI